MNRLSDLWRALRKRPRPRPERRRIVPTADGLEARRLLSAVDLPSAGPPLVMISASPNLGQGVRVSYEVDQAGSGAGPLTFGVYRSADDQLDPSDQLLALAEVDGSPGSRDATIAVEGGLPPEPARPYVLVASQSNPEALASFRTHAMAVIVHGGVQNQSWKNGPPWELVMAKTLQDQGYESVVPFNWVSESHRPGAVLRQGLRLASAILDASGAFPGGEPVDLHLIGHSEGAVVATQALKQLGPAPTPELADGYLRLTLLDPYSASNGVPGQNASFNGPLGGIAEAFIDSYQSRADDPPVFVPQWVDGAEVFYQQTPASRDHGTNSHIYNLWGQVPVRGVSVYYDLTPASVTHSGKTGLAAWYQRHVVPTLGEGAPGLASLTLSVARGGGEFSGKAGPGSTVRLLYAEATDPNALRLLGRTEASPEGDWSIRDRLLPGRYRVVARSAPDPGPSPPRIPVVSTAMLGMVIEPPRARGSSGS